jgi:parallel beta-helix repeat protein
MDSEHTLNAVFTQTSAPTYVVAIEGSNYVARNSAGTAVVTNTDFGAMMNNLNELLKSGDVILLKNGVYLVGATTPTNTNKDGITYKGESRDGTIIRAASTTSTGNLLVIYSGAGGDHPANCIVEDLTFDANFNTVISPTVLIGGSYNTVQYCHFINTMQYGLHAWRAHNFKFINNRVEKAQYGISSGADNAEWNTGGLIANNYITDSMQCGIKLRWIKDTTVSNNTIDITYVTWNGDVYNGVSYNGCTGIRLYHADGPTQNITVSNNVIYDRSTVAGETVGIGIDADNLANQGLPSSISSGSTIVGNSVMGCNWGVLSELHSVVIKQNTIADIKPGKSMGGMGIDLVGSPNSQVTDNILTNAGIGVRGTSSGCTIARNRVSGGATYGFLNGDGISVWNDGSSTHADNCIIDSNTLTNCRRYGVHVCTYYSGNPVSGTTIRGNTFSGCVSGNIKDEGVNTNIS